MNDTLQTALTVLGAMGGVETVKWFLSRKTNKRVAEAEADIAEVRAETDEFHLLRARLEFAEQQLLVKEERFHEQTKLLREQILTA